MKRDEDNNSKIRESISIRGVCAALQSMAMPTLDNMRSLLAKVNIKATFTKEK